MTVLTVGSGQEFTTIESAVQASNAGDTINVDAGTYSDDFVTISHDLTLQAVGGEVVMTEDTGPPNGKAMIDESGNVTINGFDIGGVSVGDGNGAAIRYEGGNLTLGQDYFHDNQDGLLGAPDAAGTITVDDSEFAHNGDGSGSTHNIYVGQIASFTLTNSYFHDAVVGHEVKSRAASNTITGNRIFDNNGSASYSIDLPNGGNANISNNVIEQGANTQNPNIIAYGEEGASNPGTNFAIANNTIVNDDPGGRLLLDPSATQPTLTGNSVWGLPASGDTVLLGSRPSLDTSSMSFINPPGGSDGSGTGGGTGGSGGSTGGSGTGDTGGGPAEPPPPPPPLPPPAMTLDDYHALVLNEFLAYAGGHPGVWSDPTAMGALFTEAFSTSVLATPALGDLWTPTS